MVSGRYDGEVDVAGELLRSAERVALALDHEGPDPSALQLGEARLLRLPGWVQRERQRQDPARTDIARDPKVGLGFSGKGGFFSGSGIYVTVEGRAELIRDKAMFKKHWTSDLDAWFKQGADTPNLVLIKVRAKRIKYWDGGEEGELVV